MTGETPEEQPPREPSDGSTVGTGSAIGIGCLVAVLLLVAVALVFRWLGGSW